MKRDMKEDVISKMFFSATVAMIFTLFVGMAAQFFDGIITSRFLGEDAYSGIALFGPLSGTFLMFAFFIASGNQIICSGYIGEGKKNEANGVFSFCILAGIVTAVILDILCIAVPDALLAFCGVTQAGNPVLYDHMLSYMHGYMFGIPALILVQIIGPIVVLDNGKMYFTISAIVLCVTDIAGDLINALLLHGGTFGMGIATAVSLTIQLLMLIAFLMRKDSYYGFSLKAFNPREIGEIAKSGSPSLVQSLAVNLRDLSINRLNLFFAVSIVAIAARGIQYYFNMVLFCIGVGIGNTMVSIVSIYHSVSDGMGLKRVFTYGMKLSMQFAVITSVAVLVLAPLIVSFYTSDPETSSLSIFGIRCMAVSQLVDIPICAYVSFLQGVRRRRTVIFLNVMDRFIFPVGSAAVLAFSFGSKGLLASVALGKFLLAITVFIMICIANGQIPRSAEQYMLMPEDFGSGVRDNLYGSINSIEDVVLEMERTEEFCLAQGADRTAASRMMLFMEEMGGNVVQYGSKDVQKQSGAEYRLFVNDERICLTLRDYNRAFDPTAWYRANQNLKPGEGTGIRMVMSLAEDICYFNAFNSNNLIIWLNMNKNAE
jgi:Na+-driven multidrug efflux pump